MLPVPEVWFCCLHPIEGGMTELVAASALPVFPFVQEDIFRALWAVSGGTLDDARYEAYTGVYTLGLVELEVDGDVLDFFQLDIIDLTRWQVFIASGGLACSDGCDVRPAYAIA